MKQVIMGLQMFDMRTGVLSALPDVDKTSMLHTRVGLVMPNGSVVRFGAIITPTPIPIVPPVPPVSPYTIPSRGIVPQQ
jgi:hypothetical protein